jgi:hypothetical protein
MQNYPNRAARRRARKRSKGARRSLTPAALDTTPAYSTSDVTSSMSTGASGGE